MEFNLKEYVKQYQDESLCSKWHNNIPLACLQDEKYIYCENLQDVQALYESFPFLPMSESSDGESTEHDITAYIAWIGDGDYREIYVTESSRPYDLQAIYHPLTYYLD